MGVDIQETHRPVIAKGLGAWATHRITWATMVDRASPKAATGNELPSSCIWAA